MSLGRGRRNRQRKLREDGWLEDPLNALEPDLLPSEFETRSKSPRRDNLSVDMHELGEVGEGCQAHLHIQVRNGHEVILPAKRGLG